jgi:chromosome segregation ATPase
MNAVALMENTFCQFKRVFESQEGCGFASIIERNQRLERDNEQLHNTNTGNLDNIARQRQEIKRLSSLKDEVVRLETQLQGVQMQILAKDQQIETAARSLSDVKKAKAEQHKSFESESLTLAHEKATLETELGEVTRTSHRQQQELDNFRSKAFELHPEIPDQV